MSEQKIKFKCASCDHWEWKTGDFPEKWQSVSCVEKGFYWSCPVCKSFLYPDNVDYDNPKPFGFDVYESFSRCPNASTCAGRENHQPACEQLVLTPRCLEVVNTSLWALQKRIEKIEAATLRIEAALTGNK